MEREHHSSRANAASFGGQVTFASLLTILALTIPPCQPGHLDERGRESVSQQILGAPVWALSMLVGSRSDRWDRSQQHSSTFGTPPRLCVLTAPLAADAVYVLTARKLLGALAQADSSRGPPAGRVSITP